jgi:LCP family protein required for cell wall assembly
MKQKLRVPAPPPYEPSAGDGHYSPADIRAPARRRRFPGCAAGCLAVLALFLALLAVLRYAPWGRLLPLLSGESSRASFLLAGIDRRGGTDWTYRTDTIIVFTGDPQRGTAGLLSIPRDLQVTIPGYGEDRINTPNVYGYLRNYPGGGPALLEATIAANFRIPVDAYVMIDFRTFVQAVDTLGGIDVDVPKALHDTRYPDPGPGDPYAYKTVHFDPGRQHMNGQQALEYARSRMSTSDFDRARRQQQILVAIRTRALRPGAILRWPALAAILARGVKTDLGPRDLVTLAGLALTIDPASLEQIVIEPPLVVGHRRADGAAVQLPNWDLIDPVLDGMFGPR